MSKHGKEKKTRWIGPLRVDVRLHEQARQVAKEQDRSVSWVMRQALVMYINQVGK